MIKGVNFCIVIFLLLYVISYGCAKNNYNSGNVTIDDSNGCGIFLFGFKFGSFRENNISAPIKKDSQLLIKNKKDNGYVEVKIGNDKPLTQQQNTTINTTVNNTVNNNQKTLSTTNIDTSKKLLQVNENITEHNIKDVNINSNNNDSNVDAKSISVNK